MATAEKPEDDFYAILQVPRNCTDKEIKMAYKLVALQRVKSRI